MGARALLLDNFLQKPLDLVLLKVFYGFSKFSRVFVLLKGIFLCGVFLKGLLGIIFFQDS